MVAEHKAFPPTGRVLRAPWLDYISPHVLQKAADVPKDKTNSRHRDTREE